MLTKFQRTCPQCKKELTYTNVKNRNKAEKNNSCCSTCSFENIKLQSLIKNHEYDKRRYNKEQVALLVEVWGDKFKRDSLIKEFQNNKKVKKIYKKECPQCKEEIIFKNGGAHSASIKNNSTCRKCAEINLAERGRQQIGDKNPFYGKNHTDETREKLKDAWVNPSESKQKYIDFLASEQHKHELSERMLGDKNSRFGTSLKEIWIEKLGNQEGLKRWDEWRDLQSKNSGKPTLGKPSPQGSGNGWSGWYNGWFFRSIGELSYMVNVIDRFGLKWVTGESQKYKVQYFNWEGKERNYFPDFIIADKYMVESKPKKLWESVNVKCKAEAAKLFCVERGMVYKMVNCRRLTDNEVYYLYINQLIKFTERYEQKFLERYNKYILNIKN